MVGKCVAATKCSQDLNEFLFVSVIYKPTGIAGKTQL